MKASDLFIEALEKEGVQYIFGIPGEENLDLLDSLSRSSIKLVLTRHEQAAGFMAATVGRLAGKPGVCLSTSGRARRIWPPQPPTHNWEACCKRRLKSAAGSWV